MAGRLVVPDFLLSRPGENWPTDHLSVSRLIPGGPSPAVFTHLAYYHRGDGAISGTVTITGGSPVRRKVMLFDRTTGAFLDATWSAADGAYAFDFWDKSKEYLVVAIDHTKTYNAARADAVVPE